MIRTNCESDKKIYTNAGTIRNISEEHLFGNPDSEDKRKRPGGRLIMCERRCLAMNQIALYRYAIVTKRRLSEFLVGNLCYNYRRSLPFTPPERSSYRPFQGLPSIHSFGMHSVRRVIE